MRCNVTYYGRLGRQYSRVLVPLLLLPPRRSREPRKERRMISPPRLYYSAGGTRALPTFSSSWNLTRPLSHDQTRQLRSVPPPPNIGVFFVPRLRSGTVVLLGDIVHVTQLWQITRPGPWRRVHIPAWSTTTRTLICFLAHRTRISDRGGS